MPRTARQTSSTGIYHAMLRGIGKQNIFEDDLDKERFLQILSESKEKSGFVLYAYCLMNNHVHLLLKTQKDPLEVIFKRIGSNYVYWYNTRYERVGHLFQDRFKSEPVESADYLRTAIRYIHNNPVKGGLSKDLHYRYSSYTAFEKGGTDRLVDVKEALAQFEPENFFAFHAARCTDECMDVTEPTRRPVTEAAAAEFVHKFSRTSDLTAFAALPPEKQCRAIVNAHEKGASIRQLVRVTGVSKGIIEKWIRQNR